MAPVLGLDCAAHHLPRAWVLHLDSRGSETTVFMKLSDDLQLLSHQHDDDVPQQPNGRAVSRASCESKPRDQRQGLQSRKSRG